MTLISRSLRALASLVALAVIAAVPVLVHRVLRGPLVGADPADWWAALQRGELRPQIVIALLVAVVSLAWLRLALGLVVETLAAVRRRPAPSMRSLGSGQRLAALIVGGLTALVAMVPRLPGEATRVAAAARTVVVQPGDSLSRIASAQLGDAAAWPQIWELNRGREIDGRSFADPHLIHPGWELVLPGAPEEPVEPDEPADQQADEPTVPPASASQPTPEPTGTASLAEAEAGGEVAGDVCLPPALDPSDSGPPTPLEVPTPSLPAQPALPSDTTIESDASSIDVLSTNRDLQMPLGAALLVAAGTLGLVDARRRQRLRRAVVGARLPVPSVDDAAAELALRAARPGERVARLDLGLRAVAASLHRSGATSAPSVLAVTSSPDGRMEIMLSQNVTALPPFAQGLSEDRWLLPAEVDLVDLAPLARNSGAPCPALVQVGTSRGADVFVDVEAWGTLGVDAAPERARLFLGALAAELALSPLAEQVNLFAVGLGEGAGAELVGSLPRLTEVDDADTAVELAVTSTTAVRSALSGEGTTFGLRAMATGETWEPAVVVLGDGSAPEIPPGQGLAALVIGHSPRGCSLVERDGSWWLDPLGLPLVPVGAALDEIRAIRSVLDAEVCADVCADVGRPPAAPPAVPIEHEHRPFVEPPWELMVRVLGPPVVESKAGQAVQFERAKALELVVWLAQHRRRSTRLAARAGLWSQDVQAATFANVVSDARRAMARCLPPPEGDEWIGRTLTEDLPLHERVITDVDLVDARVRHAERLDHRQAVEVLEPAVQLVRGEPFEGTSYLWADAEGITSRSVMVAVTACAELARHHLALGDVDGVLAATEIGFRVLPGHEELLALRLRAHARAGDRSAVKAEWAAYERTLAADPWADDPPEHLVALRQELLAGATPASA